MSLPDREFLMRGKYYDPNRHTVGGHYVSEKLAGVRVFWDGGISREKPTRLVPWANVNDPVTRGPKKKVMAKATGLWSKHGDPIAAPDWFLNTLPCMPLDGMLWGGHYGAKLTKSMCVGDVPGPDWELAEFAVFGTPATNQIFQDGLVDNPHSLIRFHAVDAMRWAKSFNPGVYEDWVKSIVRDNKMLPFDMELSILREMLPFEGKVYLLRQKRLPCGVKEAAMVLEKEFNRVVNSGGTGVVTRASDSRWTPQRVSTMLKYVKA